MNKTNGQEEKQWRGTNRRMVGFKPKKEKGGGNKNGKKEKQRHIGYCFGLGEGRGLRA